ncbi:MAG: LamG domain-containing protein [Patescibacteria group bacterium]|nr:LamG domain-containing protein [Patescibacteria group bacterium]
MAKKTITVSKFNGGIADFPEDGIENSYLFGRSIDVRSDPNLVTLLPRTIKESGTVITALPKWGEYVSSEDETYIYDASGNIYLRDSSSAYSLLHTVPNSHGNGIAYFAEDDFLYYASDKLIGRYGNLAATAPTFTDDFFGSQGGVPLNTHSLDLEAASSQYAGRADTASLSVTGSLSIDAQIKPESLPASGETMTLVSKWDESGTTKSYRFDIGTVSNYFGDGSDGALTISTNTTEAPIDSACTGTSGAYTLSATNTSFAANQVILIHQSQGTNAGAWMRNKIQSYTAGTITLVEPLNISYATGAQVRVLKQYTDVTINSGITYTTKAWNGTVGGILAFLANGTVTVTGILSAAGSTGATFTGHPGPYTLAATTGGGFRGGGALAITQTYSPASRGEGTASSSWNNADYSNSALGNAGGGGIGGGHGAGGGGGSHSTIGTNGGKLPPATADPANIGGKGATTITGAADLTTMTFGGGGGAPFNDGGGGVSETIGSGGSGGGIVFVSGVTITVTGSISAKGGNGGNSGPQWNGTDVEYSGGGGGAGGSILLKGQVSTLGAALITAVGGTGGYAGTQQTGGNGGDGRVHLDYLTSYTGTTNPTLTVLQDPNLGSSDGYVLRLSLSSDGTTTETYSKPANLETAKWQQVGAVFDYSGQTVEFLLNAVSLGTAATTASAIHNNASEFMVGGYENSGGTKTGFYDGLIDEVRVFAGVRTQEDFLYGLKQHISSSTIGLVGYYDFNSDANDNTSNANNLTLTNTPVYSTDVPYSSPTTRLDIDQSATTTGNTYALTTAISETSSNKKAFTPTKDPQKSIQVYIEAVGSGDWTMVVHDQYNNTVASTTVLNAALNTGLYEFVFDAVWRPLTNFTQEYHFHITSTVVDGTVRSTNSNDLSTATYTTYYQFLVEDTGFHPIAPFLQFLVFGNERYIAKFEATTYEPNKIVLPAGYRIRAFGYWREYLAIGVIKGDSVTNTDMGRVYFWDGSASTYNFYIDIPEGGVTALLGAEGRLYIWAGYSGDMLIYEGGETTYKVKRLPKITEDTYTEIYPGAVVMWKSLIRYGASGAGTADIEKGVYTYGSTNIRYSDILTYDYPISTGNRISDNIQIGMLLTVNQKLLIGWKDLTGYGVDYVDSSNNCYPTGGLEFMVMDNEKVWKEKLFNNVASKFKALEDGQTITTKYKIDDESDWTTAKSTSTADDTLARHLNESLRYNDLFVAVDLESTSGTSPELKGIAVEFDDLKKERRIG